MTRQRTKACVLALMAGPWWTFAARAAPPVVDYLFPAGGQRGTTLTVEAGAKSGAKIEPWPVKVWTDSPGLEFSADQAVGQFTVQIAKDTPPGPHLVRVYNPDGTAVPRCFVVDRHAEVLEKEPNDEPTKPQPIQSLPVVVNGRLDKAGDVDCFSVQVEAGKWLIADLTCHRLGSPVDPALRLLDPDGNEVAFNHDTFGLDPLLVYRAPRSGQYVVQLVGFDYPPSTEVRFAGSKAAVYRLLLTTGPYARYAFPAGLTRGREGKIHLFGWNLGPAGSQLSLPSDTTGSPPRARHVLLATDQIDNMLPVLLDDVPEVDVRAGGKPPEPVEPPFVVNGRISNPGDVSRFRLAARKGQQLNCTITSSLLDLPLDPVISIFDAAGTRLARDDEGEGSRKPSFEWTAPDSGTYQVAVSDRNGAGGDEFIYRLKVAPATPDFTATSDTAAVRLEAGRSAEVKVTVSRQGGYAAPLTVVAAGLPEGVTATTTGASSSATALTLTLSASSTAVATSQSLKLLVVSADEAHPDVRAATVDLGAEQLIPRTEQLWLMVVSPAPTSQPTSQPVRPNG